MQVFTMPQYLFKPITRIGNLIPKNKLTVLAGLPGSGKSYSLLKFLNKEGIEPLYFNLDEDAALTNLKAYWGNPDWIMPMLKGEVVDLKDKVVVIDTYVRLMDVVKRPQNTTEDQHWIANKLIELAQNNECTVIIIIHPEDYVGKDSIIKDNQYLARNADEVLFNDVILPRGKNGTSSDIVYKLFVNKGRGNGGKRVIDNWMRD